MKMPFGKKTALSRALSKMGIASRTVASDLIRSGEVKIGDRVILDPEYQVEIPVQNLLINNREMKEIQKVYYMMHKPKGMVTTRSDEKGRKTICDLQSSEFPWVFPVGRLDKESSGLLLLTNDTIWGDQVVSPARKVPKTYHVKISGKISDEQIHMIKNGLQLSDHLVYLPVRIEKIRENKKTCWLEMTLFEGKNRQIRRTLEHLDYRVETLVRIKIGKLLLGGLKPGEIKPILPGDV
jgi:23S rRNA pseudouridine2605 synthase